MHDIAAIRAAHPIVDTVAGAGVELRRSGRRFVGRCPFHRDADPSLTLYPESQSWYCYACDVGGDVIDFMARLHGTGFKETADRLSHAVPAWPANVTPLPTRREPRTLSGEELAILDATVAYYERSLTDTDARAYLARRGISLETARAARVGYGGRGLTRHLRDRGLDLETATGIGLLNEGRERFVGRVVVPGLDSTGRATWLTGRAVRPRRVRYLDIDRPSPLLGLAQARAAAKDAVIVVEGPFDWLTAREWRLPAVSLNGSHASAEMVDQLGAFREVYVVLDTNVAGRRAATKLAAQLGDRAVTVTLPCSVLDLNELGQAEGGQQTFLHLAAIARARHRTRRRGSAVARAA